MSLKLKSTRLLMPGLTMPPSERPVQSLFSQRVHVVPWSGPRELMTSFQPLRRLST